MKQLAKLGWDDALEEAWQAEDNGQFMPARVIADYGSNLRVATPDEVSAEVSGRLQYFLESYEMPKVGDWVAVQMVDDEHGIIHGVLPRKSEISRKQPGTQIEKQVLAANVDLAFLVQALDHDFSPERIQRYLFQLNKDGIEPVLVLNKADKESEIDSKLARLDSFKAKVIVTSALKNEGVDDLAMAIRPGATAVFLGSSGVGKSTITNALLGSDRQAVSDIREADSKGRHTTTHRELFILPHGGLVIDTPGLRELQLWGSEADLEGTFSDIDILTQSCRFSNCTHQGEPGCAVLLAVETGALEQSRLDSYFKFKKELRYLYTMVDEGAAYERKQSFKKSQKYYNQVIKAKNDRKKP